MPKVKPIEPPAIQREGNELVAYLDLDEKASSAWREIFDKLAGHQNNKGFQIGFGNLLPKHASSPAIFVSIALGELSGTEVRDRVAEALRRAMSLVDETNQEDQRRDGVVRELQKLTKI